MFYVYEWFNTETGEVFYVGKGCRKRKGQISQRNQRFKEYFSSNPCENRIVQLFDNEQDAFAFENKRIVELKAVGQAQCNLDHGGNGGCHFVWTEEMQRYSSEYNVMKRPEQRKRMSANNPMRDKRISCKVSKANRRSLWIGNTFYDGLLDAASDYGVTSAAVLYWLKRGYARGGEVCYYDGEQKSETAKILTHSSTKRKGIILDGIEDESIRRAAEVIGGNASALSKALRKHEPYKGHACEYAS